MKKGFFIVWIAISILFLKAQVYPDSLIQKTTNYVKNNPDDIIARANLAYMYMMNLQPILALREYRIITQKKPDSIEGWQGVVWALNRIKQYNLSINTAKKALNQFPSDPILLNLLGQAYWNMYNGLKAHHFYHKALLAATQNLNKDAQIHAMDGLGTVYSTMGDYHLAKRYWTEAGVFSEDNRFFDQIENMQRLIINTASDYTFMTEGKKDWSAGASIQFYSLKVGASFEQFLKKNKSVRDTWSAHMGVKFIPFFLEARYFYMIGKHSFYPSHIWQGNLSEKFWFSQFMIEPILRFGYSRYPDFDVYQQDFGIKFICGKIMYSSEIYRIDRDVESPESDQTKYLYYTSICYPLGKHTDVSFYYGQGEQDWFINPAGFIIDNYQTIDRYLGLSLSFPLTESMILSYYNHVGHEQKRWVYQGTIGIRLEF